MFRLAHISDVHLGPLPQVTYRELASKRVTGYINWHRNRQRHMHDGILETLIADLELQKADHWAITGDLVNLSLAVEIENATRWLESLGDPASISVIPGNHDAYVPGALKWACLAWAPWMTGDDGESPADNHEFPYLRIRGNVALIGASSAVSTAPFRATGWFGPDQAARLASMLNGLRQRNLFRVVMIHHPPVTGAAARNKRLYGIGHFQKVARDHGCELVLHGHTHLATVNHIDGPDGRIPVVGVPSASQGPGAHRPAARYNLFELDTDGKSPTVRMIERGITTAHDRVLTISEQILSG